MMEQGNEGNRPKRRGEWVAIERGKDSDVERTSGD